MGFTTESFEFVMSKDDFVNLLLLSSTISLISKDGTAFSLMGCTDHLKMGTPGVEDGRMHHFNSFVAIGNKDYRARVSCYSDYQGTTYTGIVSFDVYADNMSE